MAELSGTLARISQTEVVQSNLFKGKTVFKLEPDVECLQTLQQKYNASNQPLTRVCLIGATHSGKSSILRMLLGGSLHNAKQNDGLPYAPPPNSDTLEPTSANIQLYINNQGVFLDIEGNDSGDVMPVEESEKQRLLQMSKAERKEYFKIRRRTIAEHPPRIGYVLCDVVIYVSTLSFSSNHYKAVLEEIASACVMGVKDAAKPKLILIQNKVHRIIKAAEQLTEEFFETHDKDRDLLSYYSSVSCLQLALHDDPSDRKSETLLNNQIAALSHSLFRSSQPQRQNINGRNNNNNNNNNRIGGGQIQSSNVDGLNGKVWSNLIQLVFERLHEPKPLSISHLLNGVIAEFISGQDGIGPNAYGRAIQFFNTVNLRDSAEYYLRAREQTLILFTCFYYEDSVLARQNSNLPAPLFDKKVQEEYKVHLIRLLDELYGLARCQAQSANYYCTDIRRDHATNRHRKVNLDKNRGFWKKVKLSVVGERFDGPFEFNEPQSKEFMIDSLVSLGNTLYHSEERDRFTILKIEATRNAFSPYLNDRGQLEYPDLCIPNICMLCWTKAATEPFKCGHKYCSDCSQLLKSLENGISLRSGGAVHHGCVISSRCNFSLI